MSTLKNRFRSIKIKRSTIKWFIKLRIIIVRIFSDRDTIMTSQVDVFVAKRKVRLTPNSRSGQVFRRSIAITSADNKNHLREKCSQVSRSDRGFRVLSKDNFPRLVRSTNTVILFDVCCTTYEHRLTVEFVFAQIYKHRSSKNIRKTLGSRIKYV